MNNINLSMFYLIYNIINNSHFSTPINLISIFDVKKIKYLDQFNHIFIPNQKTHFIIQIFYNIK